MSSSTRGPSTPSTPLNPKKVKNEDDNSMDDLTKDLEDPVPEPNIQEIPTTKLGELFKIFIQNSSTFFHLYFLTLGDRIEVCPIRLTSVSYRNRVCFILFVAGGQATASTSSKKDSDLQPIKSGTLADLDEEMDRADDNSQAGKVPASESTNAVGVSPNYSGRSVRFVMF